MPRGGVDHQAHRLVDHDYVPILIYHVQRNVLGPRVNGLRVGEGKAQLSARGEAVVFFDRPPVQKDRSLFQQPLGGGPGQLGDRPG